MKPRTAILLLLLGMLPSPRAAEIIPFGFVDDPPTLIATDPPPSAIVTSLNVMNIIFSENLTGVDAADLLINSVAATSVTTNNPRDYSFQFTQPATGTVTVAWSGAHGIADNDGTPDPFVAGPSWTYTLDPNAGRPRAIISEFMAANDRTLADEDGESTDWIEIYNPGDADVNLNGWYLTDTVANLVLWRFPPTFLGPKSYLVVFASAKDRAIPGRQFHTNFKLKAVGGYLALVEPDGLTIATEFRPAYPPQTQDISYGLDRFDPTLRGYFITPTPGAPNFTSGNGFAPEPVFSLESGVYTINSLSLTMDSPPGATIRYTTNGSEPTNGSTAYTAPIGISGNTMVKARVFQDGLWPSAVRSRTFVLLDASTRDFNSNLPILILSTEGRSIPQGVAPDQPRTKGTFVVFDLDASSGRASLTGKPDFQGLAQFEVFGHTAAGFPKMPYNIEINDELGDDQAVSVLGMPAGANWKLRNPYSDKCLMNDFLALELFEQMGHYSCRRRLVEVFVDTGGAKLTYPGDYVGVYVLLEKIEQGKDRVDIASLSPGDTNEPAISGGYMFKRDKASPGADLDFSTVAGTPLKLLEPKPREVNNNVNHPQVQWLRRYLSAFETAMNAVNWTNATGTNHYSHYIDVDSFVDQHWIVEFSKQIDGYRISNFFSKDRNGKVKNGPIWDWNLSFGNADYLDGGNTNQWYYTQLGGNFSGDHLWLRRLLGAAPLPNSRGDPDFIQKVIDRWGVLRTNILNGDRLLARIDEIATQLTEAAGRNFTKYVYLNTYIWPNPQGPPAFFVDYTQPTYALIISEMKKWTMGRYLWIDSQFLRAPAFSLNAGKVTAGSTLFMTAPAGTIYYTTDGTDPRQQKSNGALAPGASTYASPITINANARVFARARNGTVWSPPTIATFVVQTPRLVVSELMYHPQSRATGTNSAEDFEYIELKNVGTNAIDLGGYSISGGIDFTFPSSMLNVGQRVLVVANSNAFIARYGAGLNVAGQYTGRLGNAGDRIVLEGRYLEPILDFEYQDHWYPSTDGFGFSLVILDENAATNTWGLAGSWRPSDTFNGTPGSGDLPYMVSTAQLVITEIMYAPAPEAPGSIFETENFEYIELKNVGTNFLQLLGFGIRGGIEFDFPNDWLRPGQRAVIVRDKSAFEVRYPSVDGILLGEFTSNLGNSGDAFILAGPGYHPVLEYGYRGDWYPTASGTGYSLCVVDEQAPASVWNQKEQWRPSAQRGGSPGRTNHEPPVVPTVVINEILANPTPPNEDAIELFNPGSTEVEVSGWFLTDDIDDPKKFRIPGGTWIDARGYLAFDEHIFNLFGDPSGSFSFRAEGEEVYLFSADANGNLTGYAHGFRFGASESNVSFGRHITSSGEEHFVAQSTMTLREPNAGPKVGPIVLSEIHYHPPDRVLSDRTLPNVTDEYVELRNITDEPVPLFDASNRDVRWRIDGAVGFVFPDTVVVPQSHLLVVSFDPRNEPVRLDSFRLRFGVPEEVPVFGPYEGSLPNTGGILELTKPGQPMLQTNGLSGRLVAPRILVDRVNYGNASPGAGAADGMGAAWQRINQHAYGDDPINWAATATTPGSSYLGGTMPRITQSPSNQSAPGTGTATFFGLATGSGPIRYQWWFNNQVLHGATNNVLVLTNLKVSQSGQYVLYALNPFGVAVSSNAKLTVLVPPTILEQPTNVLVRVRPDPAAASTTNAHFTAAATTMNPPLVYQWRFNGTNLAGATNITGINTPSLVISNVTIANGGDYSCAITDASGTISTMNATLSPLVTPIVVPGFISHVAITGAPVTLSIAIPVGNPPPFTVEWRRGSTPLATNIVYQPADFISVIAPSPPTANQLYRVLVRNLATTGQGIVATNLITSYLDSDGDGVPDPFDANPGVNDATLDSDDDGMSNRDEYIAGTNPTNAASYLKVDRLTVTGAARIEFLAVSNRTYAVESTAELTGGPWTRVAEVVAAATNRLVQVLDRTPITGNAQRVYRLVTPRAP